MHIRILTVALTLTAMISTAVAAPPTTRPTARQLTPSATPNTTRTDLQLLEALGTTEWEDAFDQLRKRGAQASPLLLIGLRHKKLEVRQRAIELSIDVARTIPSLLPEMIKALGAPEFQMRKTASNAIKRLGTLAFPYLREGLKAKGNWKLRANCAFNLSFLPTQAAKILPEIFTANEKSPEWKAQRILAIVVGACGVRTPQIDAFLLKSLEHPRPEVRDYTLRAVQRLKIVDKAFFLPLAKNLGTSSRAAECLRSFSTTTFKEAFDNPQIPHRLKLLSIVFKRQPLPSLDLFHSFVHSKDWKERRSALSRLRGFLYDSNLRKEILPLLLTGLKDLDLRVRLEAIGGLGYQFKGLPNVKSALEVATHDPAQKIRAEAYRHLSNHHWDPDRSLDMLKQGAQDPAAYVRKMIVGALSSRANLAGFQALLFTLLKDPAAEVRAHVLQALRFHQLKSPWLEEQIFTMLRDPAPSVRISALAHLSQTTPYHPALLKEALSLLQSKNLQHRRQIADLFDTKIKNPNVLPALARAFADKDKEVRSSIVSAMMKLNPLHPLSLQIFAKALRDPTVSVRQKAAYLTVKSSFHTPIVLYLLAKSTLDDAPSVRTNALFSLKTYANPQLLAPFVPILLKGLAPQHQASHKALFKTLEYLGPHASAAIPQLFTMLQTPNTSLDLWTAKNILSRIGSPARWALARALLSDKLPKRQLAAKLLRQFRWAVPEAHEALQIAANSKDTQLQKDALWTLLNQHATPTLLLKSCLQALELPDTALRARALFVLSQQFPKELLPLSTLDVLSLHKQPEIRQHVFAYLRRLYKITSATSTLTKIRFLLQDMIAHSLQHDPHPQREISLNALKTLAPQLKQKLRTDLLENLSTFLKTPQLATAHKLHVLTAMHLLGANTQQLNPIFQKMMASPNPQLQVQAFTTWHNAKPHNNALKLAFQQNIQTNIKCTLPQSIRKLIHTSKQHTLELLPILLKRYKDGDLWCRSDILRFLMHPAIPFSASQTLLQNALKDKNTVLARSALYSLHFLAKASPKRSSQLLDWMRPGLQHPAISIRELTLSLWNRNKQLPKHLLLPLLNRIKTQEPTWLRRRLFKLFQKFDHKAAVRATEELFHSSKNPTTQQHALELIGDLHGHSLAFGTLKQALSASQPLEVRRAAISALSRSLKHTTTNDPHTQPSIELLFGLLWEPSDALHQETFAHLASLKKHHALLLPHLLKALSHAHPAIYPQALYTLSELGDAGANITSYVLPLLKHKNPEVQGIALKALSSQTFTLPLPKGLLAQINTLLKADLSHPTLLDLLALLQKLGTKANALQAPLQKALTSEQQESSKAILLNCLAAISPDLNAHLQLFASMLTAKDPALRRSAIRSLKKLGNRALPLLPTLLLQLRSNEQSRQTEALELIETFGQAASHAASFVTSLLYSNHPAVRTAAFKALLQMGIADSTMFVNILHKATPNQQQQLIALLENIGPKAEFALKQLVQCSHSLLFPNWTRNKCTKLLNKVSAPVLPSK